MVSVCVRGGAGAWAVALNCTQCFCTVNVEAFCCGVPGTVLLPLEASTPENPTHYWPYVTYRQFRECSYNTSADPRDAVVVTFRKDLTIPGPD